VHFCTAVIECMKSHVAEHIEAIVQSLLQVCTSNHSVVSVAGVLQILAFLMSGRQHRALVPQMVAFLLQTILPLLSQSDDVCAELAEPYFKAIDAAMSNHMKTLWTENGGIAARSILGMLCEALEKSSTCKPSLDVLEVLCSNHRLGPKMRQDPNWAPLLDDMISRLLRTLLSQTTLLDFDLATAVLHSLVAADTHALERIFIQVLEVDTQVLPAQRSALVQMNAAHDGRTFSLKVQRICNDYQYFLGLNRV
jgi:hypothetical protein